MYKKKSLFWQEVFEKYSLFFKRAQVLKLLHSLCGHLWFVESGGFYCGLFILANLDRSDPWTCRSTKIPGFRSKSPLSVIKARFSCILVNFTCRFEDSPSVPERSYEQSVDILGYYYASISHVSTNYPLNFYTLSIDNSFMKVLKNAKSEMPTMFHSILPSKLPMGRMLLQCPNTSMKG